MQLRVLPAIQEAMLLGLGIDYESRRVEDTYSTTECSRC